uniref:Uncharacterized protein n=1 Tax=Magallana gigas TaxID=29159 RepID=A0A8W8KBT4_MAGGI
MQQVLFAVLTVFCIGSCFAQQQGPVSLCGPVGKLILCQCSAEGCEEGQLPIGLCPSLPMMPLPPRMQCCPPMYVMYCSQQKRSMANRRAGGLNNSLVSQSSKMSPGL